MPIMNNWLVFQYYANHLISNVYFWFLKRDVINLQNLINSFRLGFSATLAYNKILD